jgi:hypothetical protein
MLSIRHLVIVVKLETLDDDATQWQVHAVVQLANGRRR